MIEKITLIVGLPGSGKSHLGNEMMKNESNTHFFDDLGMITNKAEIFLYDWQKRNKHINHVIITDVYLCSKDTRESAISLLKRVFKDAAINTIFFENAPEKCLDNVKERNLKGDKRKVEGMISILSKTYMPPENESISVFSKKPIKKYF